VSFGRALASWPMTTEPSICSGPKGERSVMVGYFQDGPNLVTMAMNGWGEGEPAWWLNLQAHPDTRVDLADGPRLVKARAASGEERERLWSRWREIDKNLDAYAARRSTETAVVILEPRPSNVEGQ
jgi:F420H(2)-dependent quinone reductase